MADKPPSSALPQGIPWPVKGVESLKQAIVQAEVVVIEIGDFRSCPGGSELMPCYPLAFLLSEKERGLLVEAIEKGETRAELIPMDLKGFGVESDLGWPLFILRLVSPPYYLVLNWQSKRGFGVTEVYAPDLSSDIWDQYLVPSAEVRPSGWIEFVQEKPLLYETVRKMFPLPVFPPEYIGHLFHHEKIALDYGGKKCEYEAYQPPSFIDLIFTLVGGSTPTNEPRPAEKPEAVITFRIWGRPYPVEIWRDGRFTYRNIVYRHVPRSIGAPDPPLFSVVEEVLGSALGFYECKPP